MTTVGLVVVAAGSGDRFGGPKQFAVLGGKPLLRWCLEAFETYDFAKRVVVLRADLIHSAEWKTIATELSGAIDVVPGGETRAASVRSGVERLRGVCDLAAVHDGARPFPPLDTMIRCIDMLEADPDLAGATVASPVTDSLFRIEPASGEIREAVERAGIRRAETPQVSRCDALLAALSGDAAGEATDDMQALLSAGHKTAVATHTGANIKVTHPADLRIAESILRKGAGPS